MARTTPLTAVERTTLLATLGLGAQASLEEARAAWKRLVRQHHPDRPGGSDAITQSVNAAWTRLEAAWDIPATRPQAPQPQAAQGTAAHSGTYPLLDPGYMRHATRLTSRMQIEMLEEQLRRLTSRPRRMRWLGKGVQETRLQPLPIHIPSVLEVRAGAYVLHLPTTPKPGANIVLVPQMHVRGRTLHLTYLFIPTRLDYTPGMPYRVRTALGYTALAFGTNIPVAIKAHIANPVFLDPRDLMAAHRLEQSIHAQERPAGLAWRAALHAWDAIAAPVRALRRLWARHAR